MRYFPRDHTLLSNFESPSLILHRLNLPIDIQLCLHVKLACAWSMLMYLMQSIPVPFLRALLTCHKSCGSCIVRHYTQKEEQQKTASAREQLAKFAERGCSNPVKYHNIFNQCECTICRTTGTTYVFAALANLPWRCYSLDKKLHGYERQIS